MATRRATKVTKVVKKATRAAPKAARREPVLTSDVTKAVVAVVPPLGYSTNSRTMRYAKVMADVREKNGPGKPTILATFAGRGGATQVKQALERGERPVDGKLDDWTFDARRNPGGGSTLFATLRVTG